MNGKTCIVTGASSGIGLATAEGLARAGARTIVVARNQAKGAQAVEQIRKDTGNQNVELVQGDIGTIKGTRALAAALLKACATIDVLINNAGIWMTEFQLNEDQLEQTFATNHIGSFLLTMLLLDRMKQSGPARIVNVSSEMHYKGSVDFEKLNTAADFGKIKTYSDSKLMNVLFTRELAKRLQGSTVSTNALHPGAVGTNIGDNNGLIGLGLKLLQPFLLTPAKGAATSLYLATSPELEGVSGKYYDDCKEKTASKIARDDATAQRLWELSEKLTGIN